MAQETETHTTPADRSLGRSILWVALAVFASLYVTAINGGPLFYYDSAGYLDNGFKVMRMLGMLQTETIMRMLGMLQTETIGGAGAGGGEALGDGTVNGSRSVVYSILVAVASARFGIIAIPFLHLAVFLITAGSSYSCCWAQLEYFGTRRAGIWYCGGGCRTGCCASEFAAVLHRLFHARHSGRRLGPLHRAVVAR